MDIMDMFARVYWRPHALPTARNCDGRPVWEPPIFDYSEFIGENFDKKREAVLKYTQGDVSRTSDIMDTMIELDLSDLYSEWIKDTSMETRNQECYAFFEGLHDHLSRDSHDDYRNFLKHRIQLNQEEDGTWVASYRYVRPIMVGEWDPENNTSSDAQSDSWRTTSSEGDVQDSEQIVEEEARINLSSASSDDWTTTSSESSVSSSTDSEEDEMESAPYRLQSRPAITIGYVGQHTIIRARQAKPRLPPPRSTTPKQKQPEIESATLKEGFARIEKPFALRLIALKSCRDQNASVQEAQQRDDDVD